MKIIVAGGGIGGLFAAYLFGKNGHAVTVYERKSEVGQMRYDWHDDVNPHVFEALGLKLPDGSYPKKDWTFVSPCGNVQGMTQSDELRDYSIERRPLNAYLCGLASEYADVVFGRNVSSAYIEDGRVAGVVFDDGTREDCDLVIDACGVDSPVRRSLPETFGIEKEVGEDNVFEAYRAYYNAVPDAEVKYTDKVYMKHRGEAGISWCIVDHDPTRVDVLIGRINSLKKETLDGALEDLRSDNPVLGENLVRAGQVSRIPVRRPIGIMVADGYAAIGDSAFMTVPLIGSGIATSLKAAKLLFEAVGESNEATAAGLWKYQRSVYLDFGALHCGVDYMKRWMLSTKDSDVDMILGNGILSNEDLQKISIGRLVKLTPKDVFAKIKAAGAKNMLKLLPISVMLNQTLKIEKTALQIPETYDEREIARWLNRLDRACEK